MQQPNQNAVNTCPIFPIYLACGFLCYSGDIVSLSLAQGMPQDPVRVKGADAVGHLRKLSRVKEGSFCIGMFLLLYHSGKEKGGRVNTSYICRHRRQGFLL